MANDPANGPLALSGIDAGPPQEAEYDAVYAAVTATERGRWFLAEFANRNRTADTGTLVAALTRIEAVVGAEVQPAGPIAAPEFAATAEKIQDIAFALRDRGADPALCDALEEAAREVGTNPGDGTDGADGDRSGAPVNAEAATLADQNPAVETDRAGDHSNENAESATAGFEIELQDPDKFAAAAAALGASLGTHDDQAADEPPLPSAPERQISAAVIPPHDYAAVAVPPPQPEPVVSNPRWYIEAPDFVFHPARPTNSAAVVSSENGRTPHSLLPGLQLLPNPGEDPAELFEPPAKITVIPHSAATPAAESAPVTAPPAPRLPPAVADIAPSAIAAVPPMRAVSRAVPINPLAALQALTEDELLALFG